VFFLSGSQAGKARTVTGYGDCAVEFASLTDAVAEGDAYAIMRGVYPWTQVLAAARMALSNTHVNAEDKTLVADGKALEYSLPSGVYNVKRLEVERAGRAGRLVSNHWREVMGKIRFDAGYAPYAGDTICLTYRKPHDLLTGAASEINAEIDLDWLSYKTADNLLWWALGTYGATQGYHIEERINRVMTALKGKNARRDAPDIMAHTAGGWI
jgi:hypothetical protein